MEDSSLFLQWAMNTLRQHEQPAAAVNDDCSSEATFPSLQALREASHAAEMVKELIAEAPANSWSSGDTTDGSSGGGNSNSGPAAAAMDHDVWLRLRPASKTSPARRALSRSRSSGGTNPPLSWNFSAAAAASAQQLGSSDGMLPEFAPKRAALPPDQAYGSTPATARRAGFKSLARSMPAQQYAQDHIIAERKRREKINQRFIELSTVIPGLKKMDKATILSDATKYVKELQEKLKDLEAGGSNRHKSVETVVLVKRPCLHGAPAPDDDGSPLSASSGTPAETKTQLPEIEARFSENTVMVRIHCEDGKGVAMKVLAEVEELHLSIIHANVLPFAERTLIVTITAKVDEGFTVTAEEIVGRLSSALRLHQSTSTIDAATAPMSDEETIN